ncbi:MAG: hypothetical protein ACP5JV_06730 [Thermus sp.]|uniref:hypothetical protein n=1 Tax=Thermus sp. TaxID=275 RepID=UPI003D0DCC07
MGRRKPFAPYVESYSFALDGPELYLENWPQGLVLNLKALVRLGVVAIENIGAGAWALRLEARHQAPQVVFHIAVSAWMQGVDLEVGSQAEEEFRAWFWGRHDRLAKLVEPGRLDA